MQGCRGRGYRRRVLFPYGPFDYRARRTVGGMVASCVLAAFIIQGCRGQLEPTSKKLSSPSSGAGRQVASSSFSQRNYLSASAREVSSNSPGIDVGSLDGYVTSPGKAAQLRAVSSGSIDGLLDAIVLVESNNRANAVGDGGSAVGAYQIRPIFLRDINRILGWNKYELDDRWDPVKSRAMARIFFEHYGAGRTLIEMARQYNGGPRGHLKEATAPFATKILAVMDPAE